MNLFRIIRNPGSLLLIAVLLSTGPAAAAEPVISANVAERPHTNGEPTDITVQLFLIDVSRIQGASQSFTADLFMLVTWKDERIAGPGTGPLRLPVDSVWNPQIQIIKALFTNASLV